MREKERDHTQTTSNKYVNAARKRERKKRRKKPKESEKERYNKLNYN